MNDKIHYLYLITRDDGEQYVGVTCNITSRMDQHYKGQGSRHLKEAKFSYKVLEQGSKEYIYSIEEYNIVKYKAKLNIAKGGSSPEPQLGSDNYGAILTEEQVLEIKQHIFNNRRTNLRELADKYNLSHSAMSHIANNRTWKHIGPEIPCRVAQYKDPEIVNKVKYLLEQNVSRKKISAMLDVNLNTINRVAQNIDKGVV